MNYAQLGETWAKAWMIGNGGATYEERMRAGIQAAKKLVNPSPEQYGQFLAGWVQRLEKLAGGTQEVK